MREGNSRAPIPPTSIIVACPDTIKGDSVTVNSRLLSAHLSRRSAIKATAAASTVVALGLQTSTAFAGPVPAVAVSSTVSRIREVDFDDKPIDPAFVQAGGWGTS